MPDPTNPDTVLTLAQMTYNAYFEPLRDDWRDVPGWNVSTEFGWENDGIRGYVFVDEEKDTLIITIKGTSARWIGGGIRIFYLQCSFYLHLLLLIQSFFFSTFLHDVYSIIMIDKVVKLLRGIN